MLSESRIMNPQALYRIFGKLPEFYRSELLEVELRRDGPTLNLKIMTKEPVVNKPKRWDKWDVVYIDLSFIGVRNLEIDGLGVDNIIVVFEISDCGTEGRLQIDCTSQMRIFSLFDWIRVEQISPGLIGIP